MRAPWALAVVLAWSAPAAAQEFRFADTATAAPGSMPRMEPGVAPVREASETPDRLPPPPRPPPYRNPTGALVTSGTLGMATGGNGTSFVLGVGLGYAVVHGVVPGVRGLLVVGHGVGGELALTATLTPPVSWDVTPFLMLEGGRRWLDDLSGWLYGVGGGVYIGNPMSHFGFQLGWVWRRFVVAGTAYDVSTPIGGVSVRF